MKHVLISLAVLSVGAIGNIGIAQTHQSSGKLLVGDRVEGAAMDR